MKLTANNVTNQPPIWFVAGAKAMVSKIDRYLPIILHALTSPPFLNAFSKQGGMRHIRK